MSLTLPLILIALMAFAAALWSQLRAFDDDEAAFRGRRRRTAAALVILLLTLGIGHALATGTLKPRLIAPDEDGGWGALRIDGRPVPSSEYTIFIRDGRIEGGRDGCNSWGYTDDPPGPGERMILSTLVECPADDSLRLAYYALARSGIEPELRRDGSLRLSAGGHEAIFRRCRWVEEPRHPGPSAPRREICVIR